MHELTESAAQVRALRIRLNFSQQALANKLGIDVMTVSRWERGLQRPTQAMLRQLLALAVEKV